jgi:hypothetical protein
MAKQVGVKLPDDLVTVLKSGKTVAVLATFSEKGLPHTTPIQCLRPKGVESILISIHKDHMGYHNMVWQKKVVRIDIIEIKSDRSVLTRVDSGIRWSFTSPEAEELYKALIGELEDLSKVL